MGRLIRIVGVTTGLVITGAILGAASSAIALAIALALTEGSLSAADAATLGVAAYFGAIIGAVAAPTAAWLALRRVPLGRAVGWTTVGTVGGGVAGWVIGTLLRARLGGPLPLLGDEVGFGTVGALISFAVATIVLRRRAARSTRMSGDFHEPAV